VEYDPTDPRAAQHVQAVIWHLQSSERQASTPAWLLDDMDQAELQRLKAEAAKSFLTVKRVATNVKSAKQKFHPAGKGKGNNDSMTRAVNTYMAKQGYMTAPNAALYQPGASTGRLIPEDYGMVRDFLQPGQQAYNRSTSPVAGPSGSRGSTSSTRDNTPLSNDEQRVLTVGCFERAAPVRGS
jgi:hypothetical protein